MNNPYWISPHELLQLWFINIVYPLRMTKEGREGSKESFADFAAVFRLVTQRSSPKKGCFLSNPISYPESSDFLVSGAKPAITIKSSFFFLIGRQKHEGGPTSVVRQEVDRPWDPTNQSASFVGILSDTREDLWWNLLFSTLQMFFLEF